MSLVVDRLEVRYRTFSGDVQALDGVSFTVADGEIMGLAGNPVVASPLWATVSSGSAHA